MTTSSIEAQRRMSGASDVGVGRGFSGSMGASFVTKKPEEVFWRLYRAQTQRAVENFPISGKGLEPAHIHALAQV
ncbi:hypothetical protein ACLMMA_10810, partial [Micrococcus luteus]